MGNSGSVHNLHNDGVNSEINAYYTQQQYLKRTGEAKKHNYNAQIQHRNDFGLSSMERSTTDRPLAAFKVLPKPTESLKLRATTNGAILHAGGTISFRPKECLDDKSCSSGLDREDPTFQPMRRSHTLILDSHNESGSHRKSAPPLTQFRRSQTLLHIGYNRTNSQEKRCSPKFDERKTGLAPHTTANGTGSTLKTNKYNKKRKAPPAPIKKTTMDGENNLRTGSILASEAKTTCLARPRIYATNSNKQGNPPQQQQPHHPRLQQTSSYSPFAPFQRGSHSRNSANSQMHGQPNTIKVPYRREKSFDAVLLRQRNSDNENYERSPVQMRKPFSDRDHNCEHPLKIVQHTSDGNRERQLSRKPPAKNTPYKISSKTKDLIDTKTISTQIKTPQKMEPKLREKTLRETECLMPHDIEDGNAKQFNENITTAENQAGTEKKAKVQQLSRIPQLKRTFYFGMESRTPKNKSTMDKPSNGFPSGEIKEDGKIKDAGRGVEEVDDMNMHTHNLAQMEEIEDNGILVHVRPTLPRRQPERPSFSPAAAWRNLLEERQRLQHERAKAKQAIFTHVETPICLNSDGAKDSSTMPLTWTPQQDLEDEDEEEKDEKIVQNDLNLLSAKLESKKPDKRSTVNSLHIFSLSLPRDVHLPGQFKSSLDCSKTSGPGLKTNYWMVPGFNSLQKFKTTLSGGAGARPNSKCTCPKDSSERISANNSQTTPPQFFQTIFGDTFTTDSQNHVLECELSKLFQSTPSNHNDNWVLHKSKINNNSVPPTATSFATSPHYPADRNSLVYVQPKSLTHVCGGKHVMYLPGQETCNASNKESQQKTVTYRRQRQRPEMARESLQDLTPVQDIQKSNVRMPEKNTHRFSFQSTVRVLEKRRLAEKLSKDAEIQEAQRLHELEAMKRVEEDFQRKRAQEKANIRNQLRIHLNSNSDNENFRSLPLHINDNCDHHLQQSDTNNNIFCRAEPDGAVSPSPVFNDSPDKSQHYNFSLISPKSIDMRRSDSDCEESELETQLNDFQQTALLIEPYLQSIS